MGKVFLGRLIEEMVSLRDVGRFLLYSLAQQLTLFDMERLNELEKDLDRKIDLTAFCFV